MLTFIREWWRPLGIMLVMIFTVVFNYYTWWTPPTENCRVVLDQLDNAQAWERHTRLSINNKNSNLVLWLYDSGYAYAYAEVAIRDKLFSTDISDQFTKSDLVHIRRKAKPILDRLNAEVAEAEEAERQERIKKALGK